MACSGRLKSLKVYSYFTKNVRYFQKCSFSKTWCGCKKKASVVFQRAEFGMLQLPVIPLRHQMTASCKRVF
jgi:hypothetical protein